jgi:hypothetical protein
LKPAAGPGGEEETLWTRRRRRPPGAGGGSPPPQEEEETRTTRRRGEPPSPSALAHPIFFVTLKISLVPLTCRLKLYECTRLIDAYIDFTDRGLQGDTFIINFYQTILCNIKLSVKY